MIKLEAYQSLLSVVVGLACFIVGIKTIPCIERTAEKRARARLVFAQSIQISSAPLHSVSVPASIEASYVALLVGMHIFFDGDFLAAFIVACMAVCMIAAAACDIRTRLIPRELCWALAGFGILYQLRMHGLVGMLGSVQAAACIGIACILTLNLLRWKKQKEASTPCASCTRCLCGACVGLGGGDMRCIVALALATGVRAPVGFCLSMIGAALWSLGKSKRQFKKDSRMQLKKQTFPLAPFLTIWLAWGIIGVVP